jgi:5-methylthioribose kinase
LTLFELNAANAAEYLRARHGIEATSIEELGGGVSNVVLRVESTAYPSFVMKQSLEKLRVEQDWFSDRERIHRECDAIRRLHALLPAGEIPDIVFEDAANCIFAMTAAPADALPWKSILMSRRMDLDVAGRIGAILARMIEVSRGQDEWRAAFGDRNVFDQLRLDPYYRSTGLRHPDLAGFFDELVEETLGRQYSLVHGDWSPKNLLVDPHGRVTAIDFEVIHYGDPAFDAGFLINHLLLKTVYLGEDYRPAARLFFETVSRVVGETWFEPAVIRHLGALMLARVDGKSPAEYIRTDALRQRVRELARHIILQPPRSMDALLNWYPSR